MSRDFIVQAQVIKREPPYVKAGIITTIVGKDGSLIYTGIGVPSNTLGVFTDIYIDTDTPNNFYQKDATDVWVLKGSLKGIKGADGREVLIQNNGTYIQWQYDGDETWTNIVEVSTLKGDTGANIELNKSATHIQWRVVGDTNWIDLVALVDLKGQDGYTPIKGVDYFDGYTPVKDVDYFDGITPTIGLNKHWFIGAVDTGIVAEGKDGEDGVTPIITIGENKHWFINGVDTGVIAQGKDGYTPQKGVDYNDGADGITPHIGLNGNWWIGTTDTGTKAAGEDGATPTIGENKHWFINGVDTGIVAEGQDGYTPQKGIDYFDGYTPIKGVDYNDGADGITPHIGLNGNWWIGTTDTGTKAAGEDGATPTIGENKHWFINGVDTGIVAEGQDGYTPQKGIDYFDGYTPIKGVDYNDGREVLIQNNGTYIQWQYDGDTEWTNIVEVSTLKGDTGANIELQVSATHIQWRVVGDADWINLIALSELKGADGYTPQKGVDYFDGEDGYTPQKGIDYFDGRGIVSFELIDTQEKTKIYRMLFSDATYVDIPIIDGNDGVDGLTPYIGINGNWWIGEVDQNIKAEGVDGVSPTIGMNGNWYLGTTDTGVKAQGTDGYTPIKGVDYFDGYTPVKDVDYFDGITPHIGLNGNWWIGTTDTGTKAAGEDGATPTIGENNHWFINGVDTGIVAEGEDGYTPIKGVDYFDGYTPIKGVDYNDGREVLIQNNGTYIQWQYDGDTEWTNIVEVSTLKGDTGANIELQVSATHIQWRVVGDADWINLIALSELKGADGYTPIKDVDYFDGITPTIGLNKHWFIGAIDTGIVAEGKDGEDGVTPIITIGENENWYINGVDSGKPSRGANGTSAYEIYHAGGGTLSEAEFNESITNTPTHISDEAIHHTIDELNLLYSDINHNHNLNDLTEKSYNSLTDKPNLSSLHTHANKEDLDNYDPDNFEPKNSNIQEHIADTKIHIDSSSELGVDINETNHSLLLWNGLKALKVTFARLKTWIGSLYFAIGGNTFGSKKLIGSTDNQDFGIITNNAERATVLKNGNIGIGTTTPRSKLQVNGGVQCGNDTAAASADKVGTFRYRATANASYVEICVQTGATTYQWQTIITNTW